MARGPDPAPTTGAGEPPGESTEGWLQRWAAKPSPPYVGERLKAWRSRTDSWLFVFAAASLPVVLLELQRNELPRHDQLLVDVLNWVIFFVFLADYIVELVKSEDRWAYIRGEKLMGAIVISSGIALLPATGVLGAVRLLRIARPINGIIRLFLVGGFAVQDGRRLVRSKVAKSAFAVGGLVWLSAAAGYLFAERGSANNPVTDYPEALWWSFTTMIAGETYAAEPVTLAGRLIAGFTMVIGLAVLAVVIATIASIFVEGSSKVASPKR